MPNLSRPEGKVIRLGDGLQVSGKSTAFLDCLLSKWSDSRSALQIDSHTSPPPSLTSGGNAELEPNTGELRVDHHLWGDWTFIRTSLFLSLNWCLASEFPMLSFLAYSFTKKYLGIIFIWNIYCTCMFYLKLTGKVILFKTYNYVEYFHHDELLKTRRVPITW